jgi:aldehyde dehydrogenase (NAD+)
VVSEIQFNKIQRLIQADIDEGAELVTGGPGRPDHLNRGYFVRPDKVFDTSWVSGVYKQSG